MVESSSAEAILFFDDHEVVKQMTYAEFQAILDNYVPMQDIATRSMEAVYVRIDSALQVTGTVFFRIPFDSQGFVVRDWNIPLQQLADTASKGPNLGAGPISLACYSQCPVEWRKNELWDPTMEASRNDFYTIKKTIKNNSLGLIFKVAAEEVEPANNERFDEQRSRAAMIIKEQRLRQKLLSTKSEQDMRQLSLDHQERLLKYQEQINDYQKELNELKAVNMELKEQIAGQSNKIAGMREYFESKISNVQNAEINELAALKEHYEAELMLQIENAVAEQKSLLQAKDVELLYRSEREEKLQEEILTLQKENHRLLAGSGEAILDQLTDAGVDFVIYHPGAGHLTIQPSEISLYLENPVAFVANHCGVNEHLYKTWLDHFYSPLCMHELDNGELCDKPISRLDDPCQFILGESDRCTDHRANSPSVVSISKNGRQGSLYSSNKT